MLHKATALFVLLMLALATAGCDSGDSGVGEPTSQIVIRNGTNGSTISTPDNKGALTIRVGQNRLLDVIRIVDDGSGPPVETDVTDEADFNFSDDTVAAVDVNGQLTGLEVGFATVIVKFREDPNDPTQTDDVEFDLTVEPAV